MTKKKAKKWDQLRQLVETSCQRNRVPGAVLGLLHRGKIKTAAFGVTNVEHPLPVTENTLFQIGSITKTYTGTLTMKLVEMGQIQLDAPVRAYLPDFRVSDETASREVTIRHLLTHTSGWFGDYFFDSGPGEDAPAKYVTAMAELEQIAPIGRFWSYNNAGFCLLGHIIEVVTGRSYQQALRQMILEPLGLANTFFDAGDVITHRFASGHYDGQVARPWPLPRAAYPAGGITCSVHDLLAYAHFHLGDGTLPDGDRLLPPASVSQMQQPAVTIWKKEGWGLSWAVDDSHAVRLISHGGGTMGQVAELLLVPESEFALAILTNAGEGSRVVEDLLRQALKSYLQIEIQDPQPLPAAEETLAGYAGFYASPFEDIHLGLLGGRIIAQSVNKMGFPDKDSPPPPDPPPCTVGLIENDRLMVLDGPARSAKGEILRRADGSIGWLRFGRLCRRVD